MSRDQVYKKLKQYGIYGRRYFYPLISEFRMYKGLDSAKPANLINAIEIANKVICLPIYPQLRPTIVSFISSIIRD